MRRKEDLDPLEKSGGSACARASSWIHPDMDFEQRQTYAGALVAAYKSMP